MKEVETMRSQMLSEVRQQETEVGSLADIKR
jgi:hypothetical protein